MKTLGHFTLVSYSAIIEWSYFILQVSPITTTTDTEHWPPPISLAQYHTWRFESPKRAPKTHEQQAS